MLRSKEKYQKQVVPAMMKKFEYKNVMQVPRLEKIVLNIGFGKIIQAKTTGEREKISTAILEDIGLIAGQRPVLTKAHRSVAGFKIRKGIHIGAKVTLRGAKMNDFLDKLIHIALPRTRDFRGIPVSSIDRSGNLTLGIKEHIVFPEILPEKAKNILGFEITIVTSAKSRDEASELFRLLGFPLES